MVVPKFDDVVIAKMAVNQNLQGIWTEFGHETLVLPRGWQRDPGRRPVKEDMIWEKDAQIPMRDGITLRADIFRPASLEGQKLPVLLAWSPYGKTGTGTYL
jgi:predicted acyl esterase